MKKLRDLVSDVRSMVLYCGWWIGMLMIACGLISIGISIWMPDEPQRVSDPMSVMVLGVVLVVVGPIVVALSSKQDV